MARAQPEMTDRPLNKCHWPGCDIEVEPQFWLCREHWRILPKSYRMDIWRWYRKGQGNREEPSREYITATRRAREWIDKHEQIGSAVSSS